MPAITRLSTRGRYAVQTRTLALKRAHTARTATQRGLEMCESCQERQSVAMAADEPYGALQFCAVCLSDALAAGWRLMRGGRR